MGRKHPALKKGTNYLDLIPVYPERLHWTTEEKTGMVTIDMEHKGFYAMIASTFFKRPKVSHISLDAFGSFVWKQIDGKKSIYDIGGFVKEEFGEKAEPLYERLSRYMSTLYMNYFINYKE